MGINYKGYTSLGLQEYIDLSYRQGIPKINGTPAFVHPVDGWILKILNTAPLKAAFSKAMDAGVSFYFGHELATGIVINQNSFPEIFDVLKHCSKTLGIPIPYAVTASQGGGFNAATAGTEEYSFITISSTLLRFYSKEEATFVIGHECGHIAANHVLYQTLVQMLTGAIAKRLGPIADLIKYSAGLPLMAWSRRAEITADRAGLLCCDDLKVAEHALVRLITGLPDNEKIDIEDYVSRFEAAHEYHKLGQLHEFVASHPMIPKRIKALRCFANSALYFSLTGKTPLAEARLLSNEELDRKVNEIVKP